MSNVFSFTGTVGRDSEVRYAPSGLAVLSFTVANNIGFGEKQQTLWIQVTLFGKRAEGQLQNYLKKGQQVFVSGELTQREYQAKDGTTKTSLDLNANIIDLIGGKAVQPEQTAQPQRNAAGFEQKQPKTYQKDNFDGDNFSDDIPF
jgi:single-strand DNA-binding protein